jgi:hypothetical protein
VERGIPALLFFEDHTLRTPEMHKATDVRGTSLNDDALYIANARAAAALLFTLARPVHPPAVVLFAVKNPVNPATSVDLSWKGGFPSFSVHRLDAPQDLGNDAYRYAGDLRTSSFTDDQAAGPILFYSIEEYP